jgi:hypothetical protein
MCSSASAANVRGSRASVKNRELLARWASFAPNIWVIPKRGAVLQKDLAAFYVVSKLSVAAAFT